MRVFLSWSGERSRSVAEALKDWLPDVIQAVDPWISTRAEKGTLWPRDLHAQLGESPIGIVCVTSENQNAPWLLFEAGALSRSTTAQVCTFLLDLSPAQVSRPLGDFQATTASPEDIKKLIRTMNDAVRASGERALDDAQLERILKVQLPELTRRLEAILVDTAKPRPQDREATDMISELLEHVREVRQGLSGVQEQSARLEVLFRSGLKEAERTLWTSRESEVLDASRVSDHLLAVSGGRLSHERVSQLREEQQRRKDKYDELLSLALGPDGPGSKSQTSVDLQKQFSAVARILRAIDDQLKPGATFDRKAPSFEVLVKAYRRLLDEIDEGLRARDGEGTK